MRHLPKKTRVLLLILAVSILCVSVTGCVHTGYKGSHPELCSVAWNNIPTLSGYISNGEVLYDPDVSILDTDDYGRVLFGYSEYYFSDVEYYVLIIQYTDGENAYYYPDDCYAAITLESYGSNPDLSQSGITALKERNDWGLPLNEAKCEATAIVRKKPEGKLQPNDARFESIVKEYHKNSERYVHPKNTSFVHSFSFVSADYYGRELYTVYTNFTEYTDKTETRYFFVFLVVLNPDESYDQSTVILMDDPTDPAENVRKIKALNGWNTKL